MQSLIRMIYSTVKSKKTGSELNVLLLLYTEIYIDRLKILTFLPYKKHFWRIWWIDLILVC